MGNRARKSLTGTALIGNGEPNRTFDTTVSALYNKRRIYTEMKVMPDEFKFETFVDG